MQNVVDLTAGVPPPPSLYEFETGGGHYQPCDAQICAALAAAAAEGRNEVTVQWSFHGEPQLHSLPHVFGSCTNMMQSCTACQQCLLRLLNSCSCSKKQKANQAFLSASLWQRSDADATL